jgi:hypothetical protein
MWVGAWVDGWIGGVECVAENYIILWRKLRRPQRESGEGGEFFLFLFR